MRAKYDLVAQCVQANYMRHDEPVEERPLIRVVVCDHSFQGDRVWSTLHTSGPIRKPARPTAQSGMQSYRIEGGSSSRRLGVCSNHQARREQN
jgi:hypothetical protein